MSFRGVLCRFVTFRTVLSCRFVAFCDVSYRFVTFRDVSFRGVWCRSMPFRVVSLVTLLVVLRRFVTVTFRDFRVLLLKILS